MKTSRASCSSPFIYDAEGFPVPGHYNRDGSVKRAAAHPATHTRKARVLTAQRLYYGVPPPDVGRWPEYGAHPDVPVGWMSSSIRAALAAASGRR